jgi:acyl-CoA synthetase (AMP-forming)/AMP-acid ligase II
MDAAVTRIGAREAYVDGGRRVTFAEWMRAADGVAAALAARGVGRGDVVALWFDGTVDYAIAYAAVVRLGAVATGINPRLGPREVSAILGRCRPRLLVAPDDAVVPHATVPIARLSLAELAAAETGPGPGTRPRLEPSDPACIIWTSGTTGTPKGAWFDHRGLAAAVPAAGAMTVAFDRRISGLPMAHAGFMAKLWEQLAMGVTIVLAPTPWSASSMLDVVVREHITAVAAVPTQWAKLVELPDVAAADLTGVRIGLSATAPASPELIARVVDTIGCPLVVRYAMTESPSITGTDPTDPPAVQYETVGRAQAGMEVELVDDAGLPVAPGAAGRVRVRGACVMRGYWNDPEATAAVLDRDGALTSSDLGRFDAERNLVLLGRIDDLYIRGGYNVYPLEVEHVLAEHPAVDRVAVVGAAADVIGEIGVAYVVPSDPSSPPDLASLRAWVTERLADYKAPDRLVVCAELPLTPMAKVDKAALRRSAAAGT